MNFNYGTYLLQQLNIHGFIMYLFIYSIIYLVDTKKNIYHCLFILNNVIIYYRHYCGWRS